MTRARRLRATRRRGRRTARERRKLASGGRKDEQEAISLGGRLTGGPTRGGGGSNRPRAQRADDAGGIGDGWAARRKAGPGRGGPREENKREG
jgi:hypothetical protein